MRKSAAAKSATSATVAERIVHNGLLDKQRKQTATRGDSRIISVPALSCPCGCQGHRVPAAKGVRRGRVVARPALDTRARAIESARSGSFGQDKELISPLLPSLALPAPCRQTNASPRRVDYRPAAAAVRARAPSSAVRPASPPGLAQRRPSRGARAFKRSPSRYHKPWRLARCGHSPIH